MPDLHHGDCLEVMRSLGDASVDAVVTDPPYGLAFMGKRWDYDVPSVKIWAECLRVLKPGGHLLAFAGTRTQHRMAVRIEDAGFEIRDMIAWVYGSGFPKSLDLSKAIDKAKFIEWLGANPDEAGKYREQIAQAAGDTRAIEHVERKFRKAAGAEREVVGAGAYAARRPRPTADTNIEGAEYGFGAGHTITAPATPEAQQWAGWGTALKPALEPITMARKPLEGTVAANVLAHGTGGLNVDGCRVDTKGETWDVPRARASSVAIPGASSGPGSTDSEIRNTTHTSGRWPANLIHSGEDEVVGLFPQTTSGQLTTKTKAAGWTGDAGKIEWSGASGDTGSAARFFYTAKASRDDRSDGNTHPTVKPTDLMRYLCRLVTPPGGVVLDPFMGSGSTGKAALLEGFDFIGIEREASYFAIAQQRIGRAAAAGYQPSLLEVAA